MLIKKIPRLHTKNLKINLVFLSQLISIYSYQMTIKCKVFAEIYHDDINAQELKSDLRQYLKNIAKETEDLNILALN